MIFEKIEKKFSDWNSTFKDKMFSLCPPGYDMTVEYRVFWIWLIASIAYSIKFLLNYDQAYARLFYRTSEGLVLNPMRKMPYFEDLLEDSMNLFIFGIFFLIMVFALHYLHYRRESKSIYVMRRLKNTSILWKTYLGTPIVYGIIFLVTALCMLAIYYGIYRFVTPEVCFMQ